MYYSSSTSSLDFAGPFMGHMFMVLVDAHSKWLEVHIMHSITANRNIELLRIIFATHGLPHKIVTDNGPTFTSHAFSEFLSFNGIKHLKSAPYHPSTNVCMWVQFKINYPSSCSHIGLPHIQRLEIHQQNC